jgi:hypothetical protein
MENMSSYYRDEGGKRSKMHGSIKGEVDMV